MESRRNGPQLSSRHDDDDETATHPSTNRARRRATSLIRHNALPLRHATNGRLVETISRQKLNSSLSA